MITVGMTMSHLNLFGTAQSSQHKSSYSEQLKGKKEFYVLTQQLFNSPEDCKNNSVDSHLRCIKATLLPLSAYIITAADIHIKRNMQNTDFAQGTKDDFHRFAIRNSTLVYHYVGLRNV